MLPGIFVMKEKWMPIIFGRIKLPFWVRQKLSYHFREGNISCCFRGMKFRSQQFSIVWIFSYRIRTDQIVLARRHIPLKGHKRIRESRKLHSKPFTRFFSLGAPEAIAWTLPTFFEGIGGWPGWLLPYLLHINFKLEKIWEVYVHSHKKKCSTRYQTDNLVHTKNLRRYPERTNISASVLTNFITPIWRWTDANEN